jgi:hypothetical protein
MRRNPPMYRRLTKLIALVAVPACLVSACSSDDEDTTVTGSTPDTTEAAPPATPETRLKGIAGVIDDFDYYGACGNETVTVDGTTYYPVFPEERPAIDTSLYPLPDGTSGFAPPAGAARVAPPGPGDDVGTMVVYDDGMARFESDSGRIIWLTEEPHTYNWVC